MANAFVGPRVNVITYEFGPNLAAAEIPGAREPEDIYTPKGEVDLYDQPDGTTVVVSMQNVTTANGTHVNSAPPAQGGSSATHLVR